MSGCLLHAALIPIYWNLAWPVRPPLPINPGVNASVHRFGGFGFRNLSWSKEGDGIAAGPVSGDMNLELVPAVAEIEGVKSVYEEVGLIYPRVPSAAQVVPRQVVPMLTAAQVTQADQWHRAGFTGSGVEVAVIDDDYWQRPI